LGGCAGEAGENENEDDKGGSDALGVDVQAIIGGSAATSYPSAVFMNMKTASGLGYGCSGAVIAPSVVLTAGRCGDGMVGWDVYGGGGKHRSTKAETFDWKENGASTVDPMHHDIGLVYLGEPISLSGYPTLAASPVANGTSVVNVGRVLNG